MSIRILYGAAGFGGHPPGEDQKYLDILTEHGIKDIDTAYIYVSPRPPSARGRRR